MAKLYKVEMYIVDYNDRYDDLEEIAYDMEREVECGVNCLNQQVVEVEWHDEIDINRYNQPVETYRKYFN